MKENDTEACLCLPPSGQRTWRQWFARREAAADDATTLSGRVAEILQRTGERQIRSLDSMLSKVRRGRSAGLSWAFGNDQRTTAIEKALRVPPGTLRTQFEQLRRAERDEIRWRIENPPVFALPLNPANQQDEPSQARRDRRRSPRRRISLDAWLAELAPLRGPDSEVSVKVSINGPAGSGRAWIAAKLRHEDLDVGVDAFEADEVPSEDSSERRIAIETAPWGPDEVETLVSTLAKEQRERVQQHLIAPWRKAPRALPEELRRPARLLTLVERAQEEHVSIEPLDVRRVELDLRIGEVRIRIPDDAVDDVRTLLSELASWWIGGGPGSLTAAAARCEALTCVAAARSDATISRGKIPSADLFAALEGDEGKREALLEWLAKRAEAPTVVDALIEAGVLTRHGDLVSWTDDGRATVRLILASRYDVDAPQIAELVWTEADRRLLADSAIFHGRRVRELVAALNEHRGRPRVGVYLAALELALALGPERVSAADIEEAWLGALYGVGLDAVPGFEWESAERLVMEVSRVFRDVLPRFGANAHLDLPRRLHRRDVRVMRELKLFGPWKAGRYALPRLCLHQMATSDLLDARGVGLYGLDDEVDEVLLARARGAEPDAITVVADRWSRFAGRRPTLQDLAKWSRGVELPRRVLRSATHEALEAHRRAPDDDGLVDQLVAWLAHWPRVEVEAALLECVVEVDLYWLGIDDAYGFERLEPALASIVPGAARPRAVTPEVALTLLERLACTDALRHVVQFFATPHVLRMRVQDARLTEGSAPPTVALLHLRQQALLALTHLGDLDLPRLATLGSPLRIEDEALGRDLSLWEVLADEHRAERERLFGDDEAWTRLADALRDSFAGPPDVYVLSMTVAVDAHHRRELWPHLSRHIWSVREVLDAIPTTWRRPQSSDEPQALYEARWGALLDQADVPTLERWLELKTQGRLRSGIPVLGSKRLKEPAFREALWRAAGRDKARRETVFEALRPHRRELDLERGWLVRAEHTFDRVPTWLVASYRSDAELRRDRALATLAAGVEDPLRLLQLTLTAEGKWTEAALALITPAANAISEAEPSAAFGIGDALDALSRDYDDDALAPVYLAAYRWVREVANQPEPDPRLHMVERGWLAERCYRLGLLDDDALDDADRRGPIEEIAQQRRVSSAPLESLWSILSTLDWGTAGTIALERLEEELGDRFAAEALARAKVVPVWDGIWPGVVEISFEAAPGAWAAGLSELAVWTADAERALGLLNRCVYRLGPSHPLFTTLNRRLERLARDRLGPAPEPGDERASV